MLSVSFRRKPESRSVFDWTLAFAGVTALSLFLQPVHAADKKPVLLGIDVLEARGFDELQGKQVGLITNQTGVDSKGFSTADVLSRAARVKLVALFSPEHGIRGTVGHGESVGDTIDPRTHVPVYSLYGNIQRPTPEML